jgi:Na+/H+ antiporter NhaA
LAVMLANSPLGPFHPRLLDIPLAAQIDVLLLKKPLLLWITPSSLEGGLAPVSSACRI